MSISNLTEDEIKLIKRFLSEERLATYISRTGTLIDAVTLHQNALEVTARIAPIIALIEIAVRNEVCHQLDSTFGKENWLSDSPQGFSWKRDERSKIAQAITSAKRAAYAKKTNAQKLALDALAFPDGTSPRISHEKRVKRRQLHITVSRGQIISQLTLFFWKRLFSADYEPTLWKRSLKKVFPNKTLVRVTVAERLEVLYQARNRLAHHEPLFGKRLAVTLEAIDFIATNFQTSTPSSETPLSKLLAFHRDAANRQIDAMNRAFEGCQRDENVERLELS